MQIRTIDQFNQFINLTRTLPVGVDKPTPYLLVDQMIKLPNLDWEDPNLRILDPAFGFGTFLFACYLKLIPYHSEEHILNNMLYGVEIDSFRYRMTKHNLGIKNLFLADFLSWETDMKFDAIVGNFPYQKKRGDSDATIAIWDKFIQKSFEISNDNGYLALVHPAGWRNVDGRFTYIRDLLLSKKMEYLEIHNEKDGIATFGAKTRYDWYIVKNLDNSTEKTQVIFEDGESKKLDLKKLPFIPNHSYEKIMSLIAQSDEPSVEVLHSYSAYFSRGNNHKSVNHVQHTKTDEYKYPVVYTVRANGELILKYSSINSNGHFGSPKVIMMPATGTGRFVDENGEYGLTQFCYAIVDIPENLPLIKKALDSKEFSELMSACSMGLNGYNHKVISLFRKDFWKEFV